MAHDVFISYSSKDRPFAQQIARALEQQGLDVWLDRDEIRAGIKWSSAIQQGLDQSSVIVVIITPDSMASKNVEDEWQYFLDKRKPIVPILHRPTDNIHFQLMRIQYVDFVNNPFEDASQRLLYELRQHTAAKASAPSQIASRPASQPVPTATASNPQRNLILPVIGGVAVIAVIVIGFLLSRGTNVPSSQTATPTTRHVVLATLPADATEIAADTTAEPTVEATAEATQEPGTGVLLDIPYVSQFADDAPFTNDDGPAALLMILRWYAQNYPDSTTARRVNGLTVEAVSLAAGMTAESNHVDFGALATAARSYAPSKFCRPISRERIFEELDNGRPVLILVNFKALRPELTYVGGHTVLVAGYDAQNVIIYDPHNLDVAPDPKIIPVSYEFFDTVITNIPGLQPTAQAIIFGEQNEC